MRRLAFAALLSLVVCAAPKVRAPAVAGAFYPGDAAELARAVDGYVAQARVPAVADLVAIVAPHAGYQFSGHVAGQSYALLKGRKYARVVVIAPSHVEAFGFVSVYDGSAYATPLGQVAVDQAFAAQLVKAGGPIRLSSRGHTPPGQQGEHALEVQLPFLQRVLGEFKLVPIAMGEQNYDTCRALGMALAKLIEGRDTLIVASSDLSHFHPYDDAVRLDRKTLTGIEEWDELSLARNFERNVWEACGGGPIVAAMIAAERLGATQATVLEYANSGDVTGDRSRVVGYGAVALYKAGAAQGAAAPFSLTGDEQRQLLEIARKSVDAAVRQRKLYDLTPAGEKLLQERGAFVTLKIRGQPRGCIGYTAPIEPLALTVRDVAAYAAVEDRRFPPVSAAELPQLEYEISVLSPLRRVLDPKQIVVGRDGLAIRNGASEGLLLPQVPTEQGWNCQTFLEQTCVKAGLPTKAWQEPATDIFRFTALVFGEQRAPAQRSAQPSGRPF